MSSDFVVERFMVLVHNAFIICDHRLKKTRHPVRSAISKLQIARSVLRWVTTREYLVLQVSFLAPIQLCPPAAYPHVITRIFITN